MNYLLQPISYVIPWQYLTQSRYSAQESSPRPALKGRIPMTSVVVAMIVVLAIVAGVVVTVLIDMKSRSWRWAVEMASLARQAAQYLNRQAAQYLDREPSGFPR